ncbi:hypothetical protein EFS03_08455 [Lentilactobacillus buchneri]|nr:hypothetical protein [Lentilactobacillus buchneri]MCT3553744.1 hypothetical protein [Lentilactobacillus buchneri]
MTALSYDVIIKSLIYKCSNFLRTFKIFECRTGTDIQPFIINHYQLLGELWEMNAFIFEVKCKRLMPFHRLIAYRMIELRRRDQ